MTRRTEFVTLALAVCASGIVLAGASSPALAQRIFGTYRVLPAGETTKLGLHFMVGSGCRSRSTEVFHRAAPGFTGTDRFVLEDVYPDGTARRFPITISVR